MTGTFWSRLLWVKISIPSSAIKKLWFIQPFQLFKGENKFYNLQIIHNISTTRLEKTWNLLWTVSDSYTRRAHGLIAKTKFDYRRRPFDIYFLEIFTIINYLQKPWPKCPRPCSGKINSYVGFDSGVLFGDSPESRIVSVNMETLGFSWHSAFLPQLDPNNCANAT